VDPGIPASLITGAAGGGTGVVGTGLLVDALKAKNKFPTGATGSILGRLLPVAGSVAGGIGGHYLGKTYFPEKDKQEKQVKKLQKDVKPLEQIDFDKLMRYYSKRDQNDQTV
jgi:hypothetical protein